MRCPCWHPLQDTSVETAHTVTLAEAGDGQSVVRLTIELRRALPCWKRFVFHAGSVARKMQSLGCAVLYVASVIRVVPTYRHLRIFTKVGKSYGLRPFDACTQR